VSNLLYIDHTECTGCGVCVDACPTGAISLDENTGVSRIDPVLCDDCLACLDVCQNDAIQLTPSPELVPAVQSEVVEGEVIGRDVIPIPSFRMPVKTRQPGQLAALAGTALTFVGSWLLPRAADALVGAVDRRLSSRANSGPSTNLLRSENRPLMRRIGRGRRGGRRRQRRWRQRGQ
jgi:NAD-dependent dihydropyrimidine dehydrogenase PreA subunit